ncbi:hypothetical protein NW762_006353 [Fusarium torreyae]|uniref:Uncharacterized protein n=1 Tax=Fusarium torreyae TaxID=1237075 RepID=A0A9W8S0E3_9HYPO|nr:hypothetical protein NW762_006353 [Fusarium torreyae]
MTEASSRPTGRNRRAKRVSRACEYCRRKRLYNAECVTRERAQARRARTAAHPQPAASVDGEAQSNIQSEGLSTIQTDFYAPASNGDDLVSDLGSGSAVLAKSSGNAVDMPEPQWDQDQSLNSHNTLDFNHVLSEFNLGASSASWDVDNTILPDLPDLHSGLTPCTIPEADRFTLAGLTPMHHASGEAHSATPPFEQTSESLTRSTNGKVSSIDSLTRREPNTSALEQFIAPGVFVSKGENITNYIGMKPSLHAAKGLSFTYMPPGPSSVGATLALCLKDGLDSQQKLVNARSMDFLIKPGHDEVGLTTSPDYLLKDLPSKDIAIKCLDGTALWLPSLSW